MNSYLYYFLMYVIVLCWFVPTIISMFQNLGYCKALVLSHHGAIIFGCCVGIVWLLTEVI